MGLFKTVLLEGLLLTPSFVSWLCFHLTVIVQPVGSDIEVGSCRSLLRCSSHSWGKHQSHSLNNFCFTKSIFLFSAWCLKNENVQCVVLGASNVDQLFQDMQAVKVNGTMSVCWPYNDLVSGSCYAALDKGWLPSLSSRPKTLVIMISIGDCKRWLTI